MAMAGKSASFEPASGILVDPISGRVLFDQHADTLRQPASLAKLMTLHIVFALIRDGHCGLSDMLSMPRTATAVLGSRLRIAAGTPLRLDEAIAALAVASANDVALALAEHVAGSVPAFVSLMNAAAPSLGLESTRLLAPHGLDRRGQVTTARDIARLATRIYVDFPEYRHFFAQRTWMFAGQAISNTNGLLAGYPGMNGLKTGTTPHAGFHLAASAQRGERHLISVVMGCRTKAARDRMTIALLDAGFAGVPGHAAGIARSA
jgi:D-alanyl-D-alanine carboxypeptidase (penicillin-binding protein 5/6)